MKTSRLFLMLAVVMSFAACKKTDEEAPQIGEVRINGALAGEHVHIDAGETMTLSIAVSDNEGLSQLKIDIHANNDGHSHEGHSHGGGGAEGQWEELVIVDFSDNPTSQVVERSFSVPQTIRGEWHLGLRVVDQAGNESPERIIELDIDNDLIPMIDVESVNGQSPSGEVEVAPGAMISMVGTVTDASGLDELHIKVKLENGTVIYDEEVELGGVNAYDLSGANFMLPDHQGAHHGELHVEAKNTNGLKSEREIELHFED